MQLPRVDFPGGARLFLALWFAVPLADLWLPPLVSAARPAAAAAAAAASLSASAAGASASTGAL